MGKETELLPALRNRKLSNISVGRKYQLTDKEVNIMSEIRRGDIWMVDFGVPEDENDHKLHGIRPVVIVSNDSANRHSTVFHAVPLTSKIHKKTYLPNSTVSCYQSYREGKYTKEEYVQLRKTNQELLADLENQISDLQEKVANQEPDAEEKIEQLTQYSMLEQYDGDVLSNIIDKVFIYNDKDIEIVFKGENFIRNAV